MMMIVIMMVMIITMMMITMTLKDFPQGFVVAVVVDSLIMMIIITVIW